uniref:Transmembrane protein 131 n=1 Tax=Salmo trutta TaxID=8032 RepID=A0A674ERR6_SALTR
ANVCSNAVINAAKCRSGGVILREVWLVVDSPLQRGNSRPIRFEPPMLDFHEQPVGMPKMEKVYLHNPSAEEISLISISATTAHFHASFFQNRIIPPGGNTSFDVVFLARVVGNVENTLFINTSHHGVFTYQVFGVGIPNPYRLRPFIGARVPVNSSFSPLINIHNPHSEPLQVVEMYSSGGDLHLELPTGQQGGTHHLWEIPPFETKGVMRASFSSRDADNHTAFIRIKTNASNQDEFIILPVEVEVTSAPGIYSSIEMLDFGTLRSQDRPKQLNLHLLNSGTKDVQIMSVRATPSNDAITIDFKAVTLKAGEHRYTKVASISFDASKVQKASQSSGKITVKAKEKSYSKLEIPYLAEVLDGYLGFDHTVTLFHIRDSVLEPVVKPIHLTNTFHFAIRIHDVSLPDEAKTMFLVQNFSEPVLIPPQESRYIFSLHFQPVRPSNHIDSNILLVTNASKFHLPVRAYTGFLEPFVLPPSLQENFLDFGVLSATDTSSILFVVVNSNPIELVIRPWLLTGESLSVELLKIERGNRTTVLTKTRELHSTSASPHKTVILASGYYAAFRVTLVAKDLEGAYDGAIHITTDYQVYLSTDCYIVLSLSNIFVFCLYNIFLRVFCPSQGKVVQQSLSMVSSFSQKVTLQQIHSLTEDSRFYYRRLKNNRDELEPKRKSKVAKIYFDASLQCGDHCYVGVPFVLKSESRPPGLSMQEDMWDVDVDLYQMLRRRWKALKESSGHMAEAVFEANADLQKNIETRVSAQLKWPSIMNSSQQVLFPLTSLTSSSEVEVVLENPADVPVYVQVLPLALYPNLPAVTHKLRLPHFTPDTMEFQVHRNHVSLLCSAGFAEGSTTQPYVYNLMLQPEEVRSLRVKFSPVSNHTVSSLLMLRNNLTVMEFLVVQGQGSYERLKVGGKAPGPGGFLRFKMTESLLKDCTDKMKLKEPNVTLRKSFKLENTGQLEINIQSTEINGRLCEGFGFKVLNCQEFSLKPNASKEIVILFTPDFTASRVIRELKFITTGGSYFVFSLNASLPYHMLAACAAVLPRPNWELELYVIVSVIMSSMFLLVIVAAYLEALGIWEPFKRRMCFETSICFLNVSFCVNFDFIQFTQCNESVSSSSLLPASAAKGKVQQTKAKAPKKKEEKEKRIKGRAQGGEELREDNDDSSSTTTENSNPDIMEDNKGKKKYDTPEAHSKSKNKKPAAITKEKSQMDAKSRWTPFQDCVGLCLSLVSGPLVPSSQTPVPRVKLEDFRPSLLAKFLFNEPVVQELGNSSGSEGEKDISPPPEWDCVPLHIAHNAVDSLQQISLQTMNADPFLKRPIETPPPPSSDPFLKRPIGTPPPPSSDPFLKRTIGTPPPPSEVGLMSSASGIKNKLTKSVSVPGQNGNPTFAAVAAGFDKSPGCSVAKAAVGSRDRDVLQHLSSVESDGSDSSGLWSPVGNGRRPSLNSVNSFSAFGPSNTFNLSGVFSGMTSGRSAMEPQQSWPEFRHTTPSVWPNESLQPLQPWSIQPSSSSPATPTTSILGSSSMWGSSPPFSPSIWSTSPPSDSPLHSFSPSSASPLTDLMGSTDSGTPLPAPTKPSPTQLSPSYNPWSMWRPTFSRRSSEPWPNQSDSSTG